MATTAAIENPSKSAWAQRAVIALAAALALAVGVPMLAPTAAGADEAPVSEVSAEQVQANAYNVQGGVAVVEEYGMDWPYAIQGGHLGADGTGTIELDSGTTIEVLSWHINPHFGGMMTFNYEGTFYYGELQTVGPNIYEGDFESYFGDIEFMPILLSPAV